MKYFNIITAISLLSSSLIAQNDIDAIRYSQLYFGGTSRTKAMAGSFGALGADGSCMGINPAGIGVYKKGDVNLSLGMLFNSTEATHNGSTNKSLKANVNFDGLTLVRAWDGVKNKENHHALGINCSQKANFNSNITIDGMSNNKSITADMIASSKNTTVKNLEASFAGLAYETYLIDTMGGPTKYYSFVDTKYDVKQSKEIQTTGRINDWNINYAYGYKDKLYLGVALGIVSVNYNYSSIYSEADVNDSMRITKTGNTITDTYSYPVYYYTEGNTGNLFGGFKDLSYKESFKTSGSGYNLKLGVLYRATEFLRLGASFVSPTVYNLTDTYIYSLTTRFDNGVTQSSENPESPGGIYKYKIYTPMKVTASAAFLYQKLGSINIDYDYINYSQASLQENSTQLGSLSTFAGVNNVIKNKYASTSNLRIGAEANVKPLFIRLGYAMYGSPFGETFSGDFVKSFFTGGVGFRKNKFYVDVAFTKSMSNENYYMYNPNYVDKSILTNSGTTIGFTVGSKF